MRHNTEKEKTARAVMVLAQQTRKSVKAVERANLVAQALAKRLGVTTPTTLETATNRLVP
jgi:putative heme iron utilization protein